MKPKLWNGPSAIGEAAERNLQLIDVPYLSHLGFGVEANKHGQFSEVLQTSPQEEKEGDPYLLVNLLTKNAGQSYWKRLLIDPENRVFEESRVGDKQVVSGAVYTELFGGMALVGDDYFLGTSCGIFPPDIARSRSTYWWPSLWKVRGSKKPQVAPASTEALTGRRHVSFAAQAASTGSLAPYWKGLGGCASGWIDATKRYGFGWSFPQDDTIGTGGSEPAAISNYPTFWRGNTGQMSMSGVILPHYAGRYHYCSSVQCYAPGKLCMLVLVREEDGQAQAAPYLLLSDDHGANWSVASAAFLNPYLYLATAAHTDVPAGTLLNNQLELIAGTFQTAYVGNGVSLVWFAGAWDSVAGEFSVKLFRWFGGSLTQQAWPGDAWYCWKVFGAPGEDPFQDNDVSFGFSTNYEINPLWGDGEGHFGPWCFGSGRAYFPVRAVPANNGDLFDQEYELRAVFTHDAGLTWQTTGRLNELCGNPSWWIGPKCAVIEPMSAEEDGKLVFIGHDPVANKSHLIYFDGNFTFKKTRRIGRTPPGVRHLPSGQSFVDPYAFYGLWFNKQVLYIGNKTRPQYVYPGLPGVFDRPTE